MIAENAAGLRNLFKLTSLASFEGQLGKWSRMDAELIAEHAGGIIATTGCPSGEVQTRLRLGQDREALESAARWREIFGPDNYFLELMDHGLTIERRVRDGCSRSAASSVSRRWPPTTATTSLATPRTTTRRCCACRPAKPCRIRLGSSSKATAIT
ncbi:PHP domain protein [Mycobacterium xenopi 3993]|nr:PHP domain protein [Mycobacterium xenopi 3993]